MSDNNDNREQGNDFFSNMMFGRKPEPPVEEKKQSEKEATQIEQVIELVQAIGPVLEQFAPVATAAKSYLSKKMKDWVADTPDDEDKSGSS
ncbi:hypothetical protein [Alkalicoccobacillus murimartini]|uniref:Uncharacterized protein n=1 Tax=Alkalicoccobacillus murimartini TaxID=171685 RepID=A0ABT9YJ76_9BACI|nr:hypothetical protein [Alkalicoccobacillus murimartini]MDQ0207922.1 hypothetical protein [Alkalicoccobacillus murimartini]